MTFLARDYWESRYATGGHSGHGSQGDAGAFKADYINALLRRRDVESVIDWGCGDGELLSLLDLDTTDYLGVDVSPSALALCAAKNPGRTLMLYREYFPVQADLAMSIDILFHFPDDQEYERYLLHLFHSATRYVLIHNAEHGDPPNEHVRWRPVSADVAERFPAWTLAETAPGINGCEFRLYALR